MSSTVDSAIEIRPFAVEISDEALDDLRRRIEATQWPEQETVADESQGVPLATMQRLARYWATEYDWRTCEARLNALPQFMTEIDGLDIHFIHFRSHHDDALPLVVNHGWPGSIIEQLKIIDRLTDPTAHGGNAEDAFHVVIPSMPGYGFSGKPAETGWGPERMGRAWAELMGRLGYSRYVAQGGDWGAFVVDQMGLQAPEGLLAIHSNMPATVPIDLDKASQAGDPPPAGLSAEERRAYEQLIRTYGQVEYARYMAARPQTLYGIADSPVGLAAWLLDHNDANGQPAAAVAAALDRTTSDMGELTRDEMSPSPSFPASSIKRLAAGPSRRTPTSFTSTKSTRAATSPPGSSRSSSVTSCAQRSAHCDDKEVVMSTVETGTEIRPFHLDIPQEQLDDLRRRIAATRWPSRELVPDRSQGVQLATLQELARYWVTEYDWRTCEARLNALPQFTTEIDGVEIHFIHVKSQHDDALPLIMTHGWPGSVIELLETVGPLTDPTAHGGDVEDAFHLVLPSLPGYGFSREPSEVGWDPGRVGRAWAELMHRLGYTRYVAQGGDLGAIVSDVMGRQAPEGLLGIHMNLLVTTLGSPVPPPGDTEEERAALDQINTFTTSGFGYFLEQSTRPQTIGYALRGRSHRGPHPRQRHAVLADGNRGFGGPDVLGARTSPSSRGRAGSAGGLAPGRLHNVSRRDLSRPAQLGRELLPQPYLLQ